MRIQPAKSNACGHFSIYYLIHRVRGASFERILQTFDEFDLEVNDKIVREFITDNFETNHLIKTNRNTLKEEEVQVLTIVQCCEILEELLRL
jgi:hypothetical protein